MCDEVDDEDAVHQVDKVDEVLQVHQVDLAHQVNKIDEVHQVHPLDPVLQTNQVFFIFLYLLSYTLYLLVLPYILFSRLSFFRELFPPETAAQRSPCKKVVQLPTPRFQTLFWSRNGSPWELLELFPLRIAVIIKPMPILRSNRP